MGESKQTVNAAATSGATKKQSIRMGAEYEQVQARAGARGAAAVFRALAMAYAAGEADDLVAKWLPAATRSTGTSRQTGHAPAAASG